MNRFIFKDYDFDSTTGVARFHYGFEEGMAFEERVHFERASVDYDERLLDRALFLSFVIIGTSYYKTFPSKEVILQKGNLDAWQADFLNAVYQEGLSQFAFENQLTRAELAHFDFVATDTVEVLPASGSKTIALESGGKDSLLTATLLDGKNLTFMPWYISNSTHHPSVLDTLGQPLVRARRFLDIPGLGAAKERGGFNGHVPVTYIVASYALIDAVLHGANTVLLSIGHEGEEGHDRIGDLTVNHQWSKTWTAEIALAEYVHRYISPEIHIGSPLRCFSELKVAELFVEHAWKEYGHVFSSCNRANYTQGKDNTQLRWCGECPKCANSFLLFAPFLAAEELRSLFNGQDLFEKPLLQETFKGLLGIDGVMKPFECVGEVDELRLAYYMAMRRGGYGHVSFNVPESSFDYEQEYESQAWARQMVQ